MLIIIYSVRKYSHSYITFPQENIPQLRDITNNPTDRTSQNNGTGMYAFTCLYNILVQNYGYIKYNIVCCLVEKHKSTQAQVQLNMQGTGKYSSVIHMH